MRTDLLFVADSSILDCQATVIAVGQDNGCYWVELSRSPAHPAGGGQPGDRGMIAGIRLLDVQLDQAGGLVRHWIAEKPSFEVGELIDIRLDADWRRLCSLVHSGGHLLAAAARIAPDLEPISGHHHPGEGRVEFKGVVGKPSSLVEMLNNEARELISADLPIFHYQTGGGNRMVSIGGMRGWRCGGTHMSRTGELADFAALRLKASPKNGSVRISYTVRDRRV